MLKCMQRAIIVTTLLQLRYKQRMKKQVFVHNYKGIVVEKEILEARKHLAAAILVRKTDDIVLMDVVQAKCADSCLPRRQVCTLESEIVVPVRLSIFEKFSHQYFLIPASTFINFCN